MLFCYLFKATLCFGYNLFWFLLFATCFLQTFEFGVCLCIDYIFMLLCFSVIYRSCCHCDSRNSSASPGCLGCLSSELRLEGEMEAWDWDGQGGLFRLFISKQFR